MAPTIDEVHVALVKYKTFMKTTVFLLTSLCISYFKGVTLWDEETLKNMTRENPQRSSEFHVSASDSFESKSKLLDVSASLQASLLGGLVEVGGSAHYLNDNKESHKQSRVTLQYRATTAFKQLLVTSCHSQKVDSVVDGLATHVVTGILYGANSFFVFDSQTDGSSSVEEIQGQMKVVVDVIPSIHGEVSVDSRLTKNQQNLAESLSCTFYGDLLLQSNPSTFTEAVDAYKSLPALLGENHENVVPQLVWLMPLKYFYSQAAEVKNGISVGVLRRSEETLEDVKQIKMRCNDCLQDTTVNTFSQIHDKLSTFYKLCNYYEAAIQLVIAQNLPLIRAGEADEKSIIEKLKDREKSPFSHEKLSKWMENKEREVNVIRSCLEIMKGIKIIPNQSELDREVLKPGNNGVLCFVFTSLETSDPHLQEMAKYVDPFVVQDAGVALDESFKAAGSQDEWYYRDEVITYMRKKAERLESQRHEPSNFIVAIANKSYPGACIYQYMNGILLTDNFK